MIGDFLAVARHRRESDMSLAYKDYWRRKQLLSGPVPRFPVSRWWRSDGLSDAERAIFDAVKGADSLLDWGAGDFTVKKKLQAAGFRGEYHSQDIGTEYEYTYRDFDEVSRTYQAVLCLDVVEHLALDDALGLLNRLADLLAPGGVLVVQTPNARCIRDPMGNDMTHVHVFNITDLWAYLTCQGLDVAGYRVEFGPARPSFSDKIRSTISRLVIARALGADYADNILVIGRRPNG